MYQNILASAHLWPRLPLKSQSVFSTKTCSGDIILENQSYNVATNLMDMPGCVFLFVRHLQARPNHFHEINESVNQRFGPILSSLLVRCRSNKSYETGCFNNLPLIFSLVIMRKCLQLLAINYSYISRSLRLQCEKALVTLAKTQNENMRSWWTNFFHERFLFLYLDLNVLPSC